MKKTLGAAADLAALVDWLCVRGASLRYAKFWTAPIGPWTRPMWEVQVATRAAAEDAADWLARRHVDGSVFVHPNTPGTQHDPNIAWDDHFQHGWWAHGPAIPLRDIWAARRAQRSSQG